MQFVTNETAAALRIATWAMTTQNAEGRAAMISVARQAPLLLAHAPSICSRLDSLEAYVPGIVERVVDAFLLPTIEPFLDQILERFDDIEPHLP